MRKQDIGQQLIKYIGNYVGFVGDISNVVATGTTRPVAQKQREKA